MHYDSHSRSRPQISIPASQLPPGARQPINPSPSSRLYSPWAFEVTPPPYREDVDGHVPSRNPWDEQNARQRTQSMVNLSRTSNMAAAPGIVTPMAFPEPQICRSVSQRAVQPALERFGHRPSRSDVQVERLHQTPSMISLASSYRNEESDDYAASNESYGDEDSMTSELSNLSIDGVRKFQSGELAEADQDWHRLVPPEAVDALGKSEVQRQSVIFETLKSEKEYVADLEAVHNVFIIPLKKASPPIIAPAKLSGFISEVFGNFDQILSNHQRMLGALFARQRDQHPLIQSVADIVLDATLKSDFRSAYEVYIKHYPLSESHHRRELKTNANYQAFIQSAASDPRIRKRDLITFLSRPVTRLPRLNLLLEQTLKLTDNEHPDKETLPIILNILSDTIKSTQPGIEAAESKVKFWSLCESLDFQKGEIIDMDLYDNNRTLIYSGPASRRSRSGHGWQEQFCALLDNYFLITREETRPNGAVKRRLMSRPLSLSYLKLGPFDSAPETRKEHRSGGTLSGLLYQNVNVYPFTIYHSANTLGRRYTLYVSSEAIRKKWYNAFVDALAVHHARQEGNMFFVPQPLTQRFFRSAPATRGDAGNVTGRIITAVPFVVGGREFLAVACPSGIYVSIRGDENYRKALDHHNATSLAALQTTGAKTFNRLVVYEDTSLISYSLELLAQVALGRADPKSVSTSRERVAPADFNVLFFKYLHIRQRVLVIYASKKFLQSSLNLHVLEAVDISEVEPSRKKRHEISGPKSFRPFGQPGYVPKDAYDITPLTRTIGICSRDGIVVVDPTDLSKSRIAIVPDFSEVSDNPPMAKLKERLSDAKALGLVRSNKDELLAIYDTIGFYITKHGVPCRQSGFIKWENTAFSCAPHGGYILLFSYQFIEIRHVFSGRLVQVIEGQDIRLMYSSPRVDISDFILVAMRGDRSDENGVMEKVVELKETREIGAYTATPVDNSRPAGMWDEWDM
ncbi:hypothetical protein E1B28_011258 [Marasmius oreades]|uniref:Rho1 guanine nucleotide exchange factor 1 n=1 Tax=Marasmius oreades TaxID=181124 RepID=A0A9P7RTP8_9AGAR|nr:uncharacterized protein E1B28_011258 [Marasmius oreades]KAG7089591.1 hypothetical protein E1B28_011258 [Marasmius oreades]